MNIVKDRDSNRSKGFGFVTYETSQEADDAVNGAEGQVFFFFLFLLQNISHVFQCFEIGEKVNSTYPSEALMP